MERIGLLAGGGNFPYTFAKEAKRKGAKIIAFCFEELTSPEINNFVDKAHWIDISKFQIPKFIFLLLAERIKKMVMVGKVEKALIFTKLKNNKEVQKALKETKDNTDYSILSEATNRLGKIGIKVIDGLDYLKDLVPQKGVLTKRQLSEDEKRDMDFGVGIAKELARLDIGQTITVKNRVVITVEAIEGTDETIERAARYAKDDIAVIKVARPNQDMRWDVPFVGPETIKAMIKAKARILALESGKMFLADRKKVIEEADSHNITIVAV